MTHKYNIHGHNVSFEEDAKKGAEHLAYDLSLQEAEVYFQQAKFKGKAQFEDDQDRDYTLIRSKDGAYSIERRKKGGWFW